MFTDGTIWNWTFDLSVKGRMSVADRRAAASFPREANQRTIADEFCPKPVIGNAR